MQPGGWRDAGWHKGPFNTYFMATAEEKAARRWFLQHQFPPAW